MTVTKSRVIALALCALVIGQVSSAGECNIYCKNVLWDQTCTTNLTFFGEWMNPCCSPCKGDGTTLCVDATDQSECALYGQTQWRSTDGSAQCACFGDYDQTDATTLGNPADWDPFDWYTCGGVAPVSGTPPPP